MDQSEVIIQVTWSIRSNQRPVFTWSESSTASLAPASISAPFPFFRALSITSQVVTWNRKIIKSEKHDNVFLFGLSVVVFFKMSFQPEPDRRRKSTLSWKDKTGRDCDSLSSWRSQKCCNNCYQLQTNSKVFVYPDNLLIEDNLCISRDRITSFSKKWHLWFHLRP